MVFGKHYLDTRLHELEKARSLKVLMRLNSRFDWANELNLTLPYLL
jgi:hypothetical protein